MGIEGESAGVGVSAQDFHLTSQVTTTSTSYVVITGMSLTIPNKIGGFCLLVVDLTQDMITGPVLASIFDDSADTLHDNRLQNSGFQSVGLNYKIDTDGSVLDVRHKVVAGTSRMSGGNGHCHMSTLEVS